MSIKLLVADDEDVIRNGITKYIQLHSNRFEKIYMAENGQEAIDLIFKHKPDIMLLDVQMPLKSGIEVIQEAARAGIIPVTVILSGHDDFKYAQQAMRYGVRDYLLKPSRSSEIMQKLNELADEIYGSPHNRQQAEDKSKNQAVERAKEYIKEHYYENITLNQVAEQAGITSGYLSTLFTQNLNCGFVDYLNEVRINHACTYLQQNYLKTYEIAFKVGFNDEKYFSRVFKKVKMVSPYEYRRRGYEIDSVNEKDEIG